jgi:hypothetical protein
MKAILKACLRNLLRACDQYDVEFDTILWELDTEGWQRGKKSDRRSN